MIPPRACLWIAINMLIGSGLVRGDIAVEGRKFVRSPGETGKKGEWVLYERGAPQHEGTRRWLTKKVLVELKQGQAVPDLKKVAGVAKTEARGKYAVVEFGGNPDAALAGAEILRKQTGVRSAEPMLARRMFPRWMPNDPLFGYNAANPGYQWHLQNTGQTGAAGIDVKVVPAWESYRGSGVRIGIVDDGLEVTHPDLAANVDLANSHDFNDGDEDPSPGPGDSHGTCCAGVAAARGDNGIGVTGCAPEAKIVGMRLIAEPITDDQEADAFAFKSDVIDIKSNSWGPFNGAYGTGGPGILSRAALETAATTGRQGKGTIFLWAAGNGNDFGDDSNYDGYANSPYAIAVSAINDKGRPSWYSSPGSNILVCAPSSGGKQGITTTDRTGREGYNEEGGTVEFPDYTDWDYTNTFSGTSSATPAVAGVVALMLQANPNLTYRDIQEILVQTAGKNNPTHGSWVTNGAGFHFSNRFGAGLVNAQEAVATAATWTNVQPRQERTMTTSFAAPLSIPDFDEKGVSHTFSVPLSDNLRLEHVTVHVKATHPCVGNLEWRLVSPSGVTVQLARARSEDFSANLDWTFMTTHFWGERSHGDWKLEVADLRLDDEGTLDEATITFFGTPVASPLPPPVITSDSFIVGYEGRELRHQITASNFPTSFDAGLLYEEWWGYDFGDPPDGLTVDPQTGLITGTPTVTGEFDAYQSATNATDTVAYRATFYILAATPALSEAVEQPISTKLFAWGYANPSPQTTTTHDTVDAIELGGVGDEEYSVVEFFLNGPGKLEFWWKVSSEKYCDYLQLEVDGRIRGSISGEVDWTKSTTDLGDGEHHVYIYYIKDPGTAEGQDRGWIDEMAFNSSMGQRPLITTSIVQAYQGMYLRSVLEAENKPSTWEALTPLPSGLTLSSTTGLIYGTAADVGEYPVQIRATNDAGSTDQEISIHVDASDAGLADALLASPQQMVVSTSGNLGWIAQGFYSHGGNSAVRSGSIADNQESVLTTQVTVDRPCKLVFYWAVSSEANFDFLRFYLDDVEQEAISGESGWIRRGFFAGAGTHTLRWVYSKDEATQSGRDFGLIDQLEIYYDNDGDGVYQDMEQWFGTSDSNPTELPQVALTYTPTGTTVGFPSVPGNDYFIDYSSDLVTWTSKFVTATSATTTWPDLNTANKPRRFYRVRIP